jgi:acyl carrier protein
MGYEGHFTDKKGYLHKKNKEILEELLGYEKGSQDLDSSFLELGINSVLAVELVEALKQ